MIRDLMTYKKSKKELDKLFQIAGISVLAKINNEGKKFKDKKYITILKNLSYDTYLELPDQLKEMISTELNTLIRSYKNYDFNKSLGIIKNNSNVSIKNSDELLNVADEIIDVINTNTKELKDKGKRIFKKTKDVTKKTSNIAKMGGDIITGTYKFAKKLLGTGLGVAIIAVPAYLGIHSAAILLCLATGSIIAVKNGYEAGKILLTGGNKIFKSVKTIFQSIKNGKFRSKKTKSLGKEKINDFDLKKDIFEKEIPDDDYFDLFDLDDKTAEKDDVTETKKDMDQVYKSLFGFDNEEKEECLPSNIFSEEEKTEKETDTHEFDTKQEVNQDTNVENSSKSLDNLTNEKVKLERCHELLSRVTNLMKLLESRYSFYNLEFEKEKYNLRLTYYSSNLTQEELSKILSHKNLKKYNLDYRKKYLQKSKCEELIKNLKNIREKVLLIISSSIEENSLRPIDIKYLEEESLKYEQVEKKLESFK